MSAYLPRQTGWVCLAFCYGTALTGVALAQQPPIPDNPPSALLAPRQPAPQPLPRSLSQRLAPRPANALSRVDTFNPRSSNQIGIHRAIPPEAINAGGWETLSSGERIWRVTLHSPGAKSLRVHFDNFRTNGRVFVFAPDVQDLLLIPLLIIQTVVAERRSGFEAVMALSIQLVKGAVLIGVMYLLLRVVVLRAFRGAGSYADREVPVILSVLICMGCAWASHSAGLSPVLGAFIAGVLLADQPVADQIRANVIPLSAVFVTLFFASIGMLAGIPKGDQIGIILLIAGGIVVSKALLAGAAIRWSGHPVRVAVLGGFALAQIGEFSFVLAGDGRRRGLLNPEWFELIVSASVLTLLVSPYLFPLGDAVAARLLMRKRGRELKEALSKGDSKPPDMVVIGYGPAGREAVDRLLAKGLKVTVIESNPALAATIRSAKRIVGDATSREILVHARIAEARTAVISIPDPGASRTILALIRSLAPGMQVIVRGRYHRYVQVLRSLGAKDVADEELIVGGVLGDAALKSLNASANGSEE